MVLFAVLVSAERVIGLPIFLFPYAVIQITALPPKWRAVPLVILSIIFSTVYVLPFWLGVVLFLFFMLNVEFLAAAGKRQSEWLFIVFLICTVTTGIFLRYQLTFFGVLYHVIALGALFVLVHYAFHPRRPNQMFSFAKHLKKI